MSASDKKKLRKEQNAAAMTEKQKQANKEAKSLKTYTLTFVVVMLLIVAIVAGVAVRTPINGLIDRNTHAVSVNGHKLSITDFSYYYVDAINGYYRELYNSYGSYAQYFLGFSMGKPLNEQTQDKETGDTWADYFMDRALENAKSVYALYDLAKSSGHEMTKEETDNLNDVIKSLKDEAKDAGHSSVNSYLKAVYGSGAKKDTYTRYLKHSSLASSYYNKHSDELEDSYTADMFRDFEKDKKEEYNSYSFATYFVEIKDYLPEIEKDKTHTQEQIDAAIAAAKADAALLKIEAAKGLEAFETAIKGLTVNKENKNATYSHSKQIQFHALSYEDINEAVIDWLTDSQRKDGDVDTFDKIECTNDASGHVHKTDDDEHDHDHEDDKDTTPSTGATTGTTAPSVAPKTGDTTPSTDASNPSTGATDPSKGEDNKEEDKKDECIEETTGYYVVYLEKIDENQMKLVNVRHILISFPNKDLDDDGKPTQKEKDATKKTADDLLKQWEAGDKSEDSFAKLANEKSTDGGSNTNGGLYEKVYPGQMVESFSDWCFAEGRKEKDYDIVETDYGYHIIYFVSFCDINFRDYMISNDMLSEDMEEWYEGVLETAWITNGDLKRMKWDIQLG